MTSHDMPSQWFDAKDETKVTCEVVNTYIEFRLKKYKSTTLHYDSLWEVFHEDFGNWICHDIGKKRGKATIFDKLMMIQFYLKSK
ncbi:hypothetical protein HI914_03276 [Erysiphe necator]|nr:hypothetical protein HI914_03276 [Erysiphe necator]